MTSTELVQHTNGDQKGTLELLADLERAGGITKVSLDLTDPAIPLETWLAMGRLFGEISRTINWLIGDWIIFGETAYGEADSSQGFDDIQSRYSEAERVTGLDHGTMLNVASICRHVKKRQRQEALGFWIHAEVTKLPAKEQTSWLRKTIKESWNRADLRRAIRTGDPQAELGDGSTGSGDPGFDGLSVGERAEALLELLWSQAEVREDGVVIPRELWAQVGAVLGKEA